MRIASPFALVCLVSVSPLQPRSCCDGEPVETCTTDASAEEACPSSGDLSTSESAGDTDAPIADAVAIDIAAGANHTCALLTDGSIRCWGSAAFGQLGLASTEDIGDDELPSSAPIVDLGSKATQLAAGEAHTCALLEDGELRCWGRGDSGRLGLGDTQSIGDDESPTSVPLVDAGTSRVLHVVAGGAHTCIVASGGSIRCWGSGEFGQLGLANTEDIGDTEPPSTVPPPGVPPSAGLTAGQAHTCSVAPGGEVYCWGQGQFGQLGHASTDDIGDDESPLDAGPASVGSGIALDIAAGDAHTCVLILNGVVRCWGLNSAGQLGLGSTENLGDDELPTSASTVALDGDVVQLSAGGSHTCALLDNGEVRCWGSGEYGQLGHGSTESIGDDEAIITAPLVDVGGPAKQLTAGRHHTCALLEDGSVRCWGRSNFGQLGYGDQETLGDDPDDGAPPPVSL